jgi:hypothetical protein
MEVSVSALLIQEILAQSRNPWPGSLEHFNALSAVPTKSVPISCLMTSPPMEWRKGELLPYDAPRPLTTRRATFPVAPVSEMMGGRGLCGAEGGGRGRGVKAR